MTLSSVTIPIPNILSESPLAVELLWSSCANLPVADAYKLDMQQVSFLKPYGVMVLVSLARRLSELVERPVRLIGLSDQTHLYLKRMDVFEVCANWLQPIGKTKTQWTRYQQTANLLELTQITGVKDVESVVGRSERIFSRWLKLPNLNNLISVLSELCANIYQHSGDSHGCVLIQKYESQARGMVSVFLAVGDLGCGIRGSLSARYSDLGQNPIDFLHAAMNGRTARATGRGGLGLRLVDEVARSESGSLWLRSETAAVQIDAANNSHDFINLTDVRGTQISVELNAPQR